MFLNFGLQRYKIKGNIPIFIELYTKMNRGFYRQSLVYFLPWVSFLTTFVNLVVTDDCNYLAFGLT